MTSIRSRARQHGCSTTPLNHGINTDDENAKYMRHSNIDEHGSISDDTDDRWNGNSGTTELFPDTSSECLDANTPISLNAFHNKNRHNKNIVIWKDGYIVPLSHAATLLDEDELEDYFSPNINLYSTVFCPDPTLSEDDNWSPDFETENTAAGEATDEYSRRFERDIDSLPRDELKHSSGTSIGGAFSEGTEDVGSRVTGGFVCKREGCECACTDSWGCKSCSGESEICETPAKRAIHLVNDEYDEDGIISERSFYSTDSDDAINGYDIVDWSAELSYDNGEDDTVDAAENYETPPNSPKPGSEKANGFHTAPNSPVPKSESFCVIDLPDDCSDGNVACNSNSGEERCDVESYDTVRRGGFAGSTDDGQSNNAVSRSGASRDMYALDTWTLPCSNATGGDVDSHTMTIQNCITRPRHSHNRRGYRMLDYPPLIDVHAIQYEADSRTGKVKPVGKGSFGQVFKARYRDPRYHHLRIVVKEFDEEFTSQREIVEEAQRLLYLRDTGFVPVCYGLVNLGTDTDRKFGIVQEYVGTGQTLEQVLWDHYVLPLEIWLSIALQCCDGLDSFHKKGILMNDIKANNIILEFYQDAVTIKYIDFGLATDMRGKRYMNTKSLEDYKYLAPEVRILCNTTTVASDVFSLGFMLDQLNEMAAASVLRFVAGLCMKPDPVERVALCRVADYIREHLMRIGCDANYARDHGNLITPGCW